MARRSGLKPDVVCDSRRILQAAGLFEAVVAAVTDDDVNQYRDAEQLSSGGESPGDLEVVRRWRRVARRMHVGRNDGGCVR